MKFPFVRVREMQKIFTQKHVEIPIVALLIIVKSGNDPMNKMWCDYSMRHYTAIKTTKTHFRADEFGKLCATWKDPV